MRSGKKRRVWRAEESERCYAESQIQRAYPGNRRTLRAFAEWLSSARGHTSATITLRIHSACTFVDAIVRQAGSSCARAFRSIGYEEIEDFFVEYGKSRGCASRRSMQASMRLFLHFAAERGWVDGELASAVPTLLSYRLSRLPRGLSDEQLATFLERPFRRGRCPRRDWAIVVLLASYGARRCQVSALQLSDIDWRERALELMAHKGGKAIRHELTDAVGEALAGYLREERPESDWRSVFLRRCSRMSI